MRGTTAILALEAPLRRLPNRPPYSNAYLAKRAWSKERLQRKNPHTDYLQKALGQPARLERGSFHDGSKQGGNQPTDISLIHRRSQQTCAASPQAVLARL